MQKVTLVVSIVAACVAGMVVAGTGQEVHNNGCSWERVANPFLPSVQRDEDVDTEPVFGAEAAFASAVIASTGLSLSGDGNAISLDKFAEVKVLLADVTGLFSETWKNTPSPSGGGGRVTINSAVATISGHGHIQGRSAAQAFGYAEFSSPEVGVSALAKLTDCGLEFEEGEIGKLKFKIDDVEVEVPITTAVGHGKFRKEDKKNGAGTKCLDFFHYTHTTKGGIKVFANKALFRESAECSVHLKGKVTSDITLDCCPSGS